MNTSLICLIRQRMDVLADPEVREGANRYFRGAVSWLGIRKGPLDQLFKKLYPELLVSLTFEQQLLLALDLLACEHGEEKLFGLAILYKNRKKLEPAFLAMLAPVAKVHVHDWGTADVLASHVFGELVRDRSDWAAVWSTWKAADNLWQQRMACVGFLRAARKGYHQELIFAIADAVIRNRERFAQLGAGWLLRDAFGTWPDETSAFLRDHYALFTREALRYAIEHRPEEERQRWLRGV